MPTGRLGRHRADAGGLDAREWLDAAEQLDEVLDGRGARERHEVDGAALELIPECRALFLTRFGHDRLVDRHDVDLGPLLAQFLGQDLARCRSARQEDLRVRRQLALEGF